MRKGQTKILDVPPTPGLVETLAATWGRMPSEARLAFPYDAQTFALLRDARVKDLYFKPYFIEDDDEVLERTELAWRMARAAEISAFAVWAKQLSKPARFIIEGRLPRYCKRTDGEACEFAMEQSGAHFWIVRTVTMLGELAGVPAVERRRMAVSDEYVELYLKHGGHREPEPGCDCLRCLDRLEYRVREQEEG